MIGTERAKELTVNAILTYMLTGLMMVSSMVLRAQDFSASAPQQVSVGQRFQITWTLNANGSNFVAPEITGFQVLGGPNQSTSMQFINGSMSQSISYSYVLRGMQEGEFKVGPAKINANGKTVSSNELNIKVVKGATQSTNAGNGGAQQQQQSQQQSSSSSGNGNDLYVRVEVNKRSVDIGEEIMADLKIYSRVTIVNFDDWKMPSFEGFWTKDVSDNQQIQLQNEIIDGVMYQTGLIKRVVLYPQKSGELTIEPMELGVIVRERSAGRSRSIFDQFFGGYEDFKRPVKSNPVTIKVNALPSGKPSDFSGLTGSFNMKATLDKTETKANEAVNLKFTISGDGNLYQAQAPVLNFPPDIEVYDPKTADNIKVGNGGISGSRTFEYVLIPRYGGEFEIGPFTFSYYDPKTDQYKTISQDAFVLKVEKGEGDEAGPSQVKITNKEDIQLIGSDIRFIKQGQYPLASGVSFFYRSIGFYAALGIPLLLFVLFIGYVEYQKNLGKDVGKLKSRKATGLAKKRLNTAKKLWDESKTAAFYEEVFKALSNYAADKFSIPMAQLNKDSIRNTMAARNVPSATVEAFISVLDKTEFARFAPGADKQMGSMYDDALNAIIKVEDHA